jgi:hypothetical protein
MMLKTSRDLGRSEASDASEGRSCNDVVRELCAESSHYLGELQVYARKGEYILVAMAATRNRNQSATTPNNNNIQRLINTT